jgi:hypothetical protein
MLFLPSQAHNDMKKYPKFGLRATNYAPSFNKLMDQVKAIWEDLQRPSADVLLRELRRLKIAVPPGAVRAFVNSHASAQVFHPAPRSNGHIISFAPHICVPDRFAGPERKESSR